MFKYERACKSLGHILGQSFNIAAANFNDHPCCIKKGMKWLTKSACREFINSKNAQETRTSYFRATHNIQKNPKQTKKTLRRRKKTNS